MEHRQVGKCWDENAELWTRLSRVGYDVYRDYLNTPAFFEMLPTVDGLFGLDIGCGEGSNTRLLASRGARVVALDISTVFVKYAKGFQVQQSQSINFAVASAVELPYVDSTFDFATAFMSLMDIGETDRVLAEAFRVLKPGGFLQFSITHPCFDTPYRRNLRDEHGLTYAIEVGDYFRNLQGDVTEWIFGAVPPQVKQTVPKFKVPRFTRTVSQWLNLAIEQGYCIERVEEPRPSDATVAKCPAVQDAQVVAPFLHLRLRKPSEPKGRSDLESGCIVSVTPE